MRRKCLFTSWVESKTATLRGWFWNKNHGYILDPTLPGPVWCSGALVLWSPLVPWLLRFQMAKMLSHPITLLMGPKVSWVKKKGGWCTVVLYDPSFRIPGTSAAISDVFGNFGMYHLVGERPSERHPERHWNDHLNIYIYIYIYFIYINHISIYLHIFTGLEAFRTNRQPNYTRNHPKLFFGTGKLHLAPSLWSLRRDPGLSGFPLEPCLYEPEALPRVVPPMHVHKACLETGPFIRNVSWAHPRQ